MLSMKLKSATAQAHRLLERSSPLLRPDFTAAMYQSLLLRMLGLYEPLETYLHLALPSCLDIMPEFPSKSSLLQADLLALGVTNVTMSSVPRCRLPEALQRDYAAVGCAYVVEGATLGGQVIVKHLREQHSQENQGRSITNATAFLNGYGKKTTEHWQRFCAGVNALQLSPDAEQNVLDGACTTFDLYRRWVFEDGAA